MYTEREFTWIIVVIIITMFIIEFPLTNSSPISLIFALLISTIIILTYTLSKKIAAPYFNIEIEHKIWSFQQYGFRKPQHTQKPFPIGLVLPFLLSFLSLGIVKVFTLLQFDVKNMERKRILKHSGSWERRQTEINESDIAFVAAYGLLSLIALAIFGWIINLPSLSYYSVAFGFWNLLPLSQLDGSKLFFGSLPLWTTLVIIYGISLAAVIF